jgi:hypothetical protein
VKFFLVLILIGAFNFSAQAEEVACASDIQKFCKDVKPGRGGIAKCLRKHREKLSGECKMQAGKIKVAMQGIAEACAADYEKFCAGIKPGRGAVVKCMEKHQNDLSDKCKEEAVRSRQATDVQKSK